MRGACARATAGNLTFLGPPRACCRFCNGGLKKGLCPVGRFCPAGTSNPLGSDSYLCDAGSYGSTEGQSESGCNGKCDAGYFCEAGSISALGASALVSSPALCAAGRVGDVGKSNSFCKCP